MADKILDFDSLPLEEEVLLDFDSLPVEETVVDFDSLPVEVSPIPEMDWQNPDPVYSLGPRQETPEPEKGPMARAFDAYADKANKAGGYVSGKAKDFVREVAPLFKALEPVKDPVYGAFRGIGKAFDVINRTAGTAVGTSLDALINPTMNPDIFSFSNYSYQQRKEREAMGLEPEYPMLDKYIPIRLAEDVAYPFGEGVMKNIAEFFKSTGTDMGKDAAYILEGFAPGAGLATSFLAGANVPLPFFGRLTTTGKALEGSGELSKGVARQIARGERGVFGVDFGGFGTPSKELFNVGSEKFAKLYDRAAQTAMKMELAEKISVGNFSVKNPLSYVSAFRSKTNSLAVNTAVENLLMAKNSINYQADDLYRSLSMKAKSLGIDLADSQVRKDIYQFLDRPQSYKIENMADKAKVKKYGRLMRYLDDTLQSEVTLAREKGIVVPNKIFSGGDDITKSTRYVPRGAELSKRQEMIAKKLLNEFGDAEEAVQKLMGETKGLAGTRNAFQKQRAPFTRDQMNKFMQEKYGIDDFFHDDFVGAYVDKIKELRTARVDKEFVDNLVDTFGINDAAFFAKVKDAKSRVRLQRDMGIIPDPDDVYFAALDINKTKKLRSLPEAVRNRMKKSFALGEDAVNIDSLRLPNEIADYVSDVLYRPSFSSIEQGLLSYQNAMKGFMFANPGYHLRNMGESFGRSVSYGAGAKHHSLATAAMMKSKGPFKKFYDEFRELSSELTKVSYMDPAGSPIGNVVNVPRGFVYQIDSGRVLGSMFKEMFAKKTWKSFIDDLQNGRANIRENPVFKFSTEIGVNGENISKLALFSKLREEGYNAVEAMRKVNRVFPDYQISRSAVRRSTVMLPFMNYFVKNAETTLKILAEAPRGGYIVGPQGALQRAIESWAGFDPERTYRLKEVIGGNADESIFYGMMPGGDSVDRNHDYLKQLVQWWHKDLPEGDILSLRLPSNIHALKEMSPVRMKESWGPIANAAYAMMGTDPFTGRPIPGFNTDEQWNERWQVAKKQLLSPMMFNTAVPAMQEMLNQMFDGWADTLLNAGLPDAAVGAIFGQQTERSRDRAKRSLQRVKNLWLGTGTEMDKRIIFTASAIMRDAEQYQKANMGRLSRDIPEKEKEEIKNKVRKVMEGAYSKVQDLMNVRNEYDAILDKIGGSIEYDAPMPLFEETDDEFTPVPDEPYSMGDIDEDIDFDNLPEDMDMLAPEEWDSFIGDREPQSFDKFMMPEGTDIEPTQRIMPSSRPDEGLERMPVQPMPDVQMAPPPEQSIEEEFEDLESVLSEDYEPLDEVIGELPPRSDRGPASDVIADAKAKIRKLEEETEILGKADLSTPDGAAAATEELKKLWKKNIDKEFPGKSKQFKEDLIEDILEDFNSVLRMIFKEYENN